MFWVLVPVVGSLSLFTFLAVATWAEQRRKERESYYRYEFRKQLVEAGKMDAQDVRELIQYEQESHMSRFRESAVVGGFVLIGVGLGLLFGLQWVGDEIWNVGYIPLFLGISLMIYALLVAPRITPTPPPSFRPRQPPVGD